MEEERVKIVLSGTKEEFYTLIQALDLFSYSSKQLHYVENIETCYNFIYQIKNYFEIKGV